MLSTEIQLLELRIEETKESIDTIILIEADRMFDGTPKKDFPIYDEERILRRLAPHQKIIYRQVQLEATPGSSWNNEALMRNTLTRIIHEQTTNVHLGDLIIMSDIDEIPSRAALTLARTCEIPPWLHVSMKNYMYSFEFPLHDHGYWRASIVTATSDVVYSHQRHSDDLLLGAGWHCSWCFATIEEFVSKMQGYSHNDRLSSESQLAEKEIQRKICEGIDIFDMYPEAYTLTDLLRALGPYDSAPDYLHLPGGDHLFTEETFQHLLGGHCKRM